MPGPNQNLSQLQGRYWMLTIPVNDWNIPETLDSTICYIKGQQEIGESGFHHWQLMVITKKTRGSTVKRLFSPTTHVELSRSQSAESYVWKDDTAVPNTRFEKGEKPLKRNSRTDWARVRTLAQSGNLDEIAESQPQVFVQSYRTLRQIAVDYMARPPDMPDVTGVWIYGPPGVGKSHFARETYGRDLYIKAQNKWWCGYQSQRFVLLDDFDCNFLGHHLKIWADKYAFMAETKGSGRLIRPEKFIVTSNYRIEDLFTDPILAAAIKRRFYIIEIPMRRF